MRANPKSRSSPRRPACASGFGLEITVNHAALMRHGQRSSESPASFHRARRCERAAGELVAQRFAGTYSPAM
jgi:hypothetical protein